jgi:putative ABC transport system permease protein
MFCVILIISFGVAFYMGFAFYTRNLHNEIERYFTECRFADVFADVKGIDDTQLQSMKEIPGIRDVFGRQALQVRMLTDDEDKVVTLYLLGYKSHDRMNRILLGDGRKDDIPSNCIYMGKSVQKVYQFQQGDRIQIQTNGTTYTFYYGGDGTMSQYVEYVPDQMMTVTDDERYGIAFVDENVLEKINGTVDSYTELGFTLEDGYQYDDVKSQLTKALDAYGLYSITDKANQYSYEMFQSEIEMYSAVANAVSALFLLISMFMIYIIIRKMVESDRSIIGTMKAMGAGNMELFLIYLVQSLFMVLIGVIISFIVAVFISNALYADEAEYYNLTLTDIQILPDVVVKGILLTLFTVVGATFLGIREVLQISPVESMAAPAPKAGRTVEFPVWLTGILNSRQNIALHGVFRNVFRSFAIIYSIAFCISSMVVMYAVSNLLVYTGSEQYARTELYDLRVSLMDYVSENETVSGLQNPYILHKEGFAVYDMVTASDTKSAEMSIMAVDKDSQLYQVHDNRKRKISIPDSGVMLTEQAARKLGVKVGDTLQFQNGEICPKPVAIPVTKIIEVNAGENIYIRMDRVPAYFGRELGINNILCSVAAGHKADVAAAINKASNVVYAVDTDTIKTAAYESYEQQYSLIRVVIYATLILGAIMVYSIVNITVRERTTEFGTYMVLGFSHGEIFEIIGFEQLVCYLIGLLLALPLVKVFADLFTGLLNTSEQNMYIVKVTPQDYIAAIALCGITVFVSLVFVMRNIRKVQLTDILKERA